jgi:hypothetical protein
MFGIDGKAMGAFAVGFAAQFLAGQGVVFFDVPIADSRADLPSLGSVEIDAHILGNFPHGDHAPATVFTASKNAHATPERIKAQKPKAASSYGLRSIRALHRYEGQYPIVSYTAQPMKRYFPSIPYIQMAPKLPHACSSFGAA